MCRAPKQFSFGDVPSPTDLNPSSDCKYDAFKVMNTGGNVVPPEPSPLTVTVTASRYYNQQITVRFITCFSVVLSLSCSPPYFASDCVR